MGCKRMKIQKPNIADYGINENDYNVYLDYVNALKEKKSFNLIVCMRFVIINLIVIFIIKLAVEVLITGKVIFSDDLINTGRLFGYSIGLVVFYLYDLKHINKKIDKGAKKNLENFSDKQINMLERYYNDCMKYNEKVLDMEQQRFILQHIISEIDSILDDLNKTFFESMGSEQLTGIIMRTIGISSFCQEGTFDFIKNNVAIKCIGKGDFLSKIELIDMVKLLHKKKYQRVEIYSLVELGSFVNEYDEISIYNTNDIKKIYKQYLVTEKKKIEQKINLIKNGYEEDLTPWLEEGEIIISMSR